MGRIIEGSQLEKTPVVLLKEKAGSQFIGTKVKQKKSTKNEGYIFEFSADGGDAYIGLPTGKKVIKDGKSRNEYAPVEVEQGDKVAIFGDTQLNDKLAKVQDGEQTKITFNGFVLNENTGRAYADYIVEVL